jgi:adenylosuccinate synthase
MLSIHTSPYYPYVTTRESTAAGIIAEAGIPPSAVRDVIGVFRTLPIRVGGNSGPTGARELDWPEVNERAGYEVEPERTTVTNRVRRIFEFSHVDFKHAVAVNAPTCLFMTFADYLAPGVAGKSSFIDMPDESAEVVHSFVEEVEREHGVTIRWVSTGGRPEDVIYISRLARWPEGAEDVGQ